MYYFFMKHRSHANLQSNAPSQFLERINIFNHPPANAQPISLFQGWTACFIVTRRFAGKSKTPICG
jgi:hypothetical protein